MGDVPQGGQRERVLEVAEERADRALREAAPREQHVRERARRALHEVLLHQVRQAARRTPASTSDTLHHSCREHFATIRELCIRIRTRTIFLRTRRGHLFPILDYYLKLQMISLFRCLKQGCPFHGSRTPRGSLRVFAMALYLFENFLRMGLFTSRKDLRDGALKKCYCVLRKL